MTVSPPEVVPVTGWLFPAPVETELAGGLRLVTCHCPGQELVAASLLFEAPLAAEPRDREGVATLLARSLAHGAGAMSRTDFGDALAAVGAELDANPGTDGFAVRLSVPRSRLAPALDLLARALRDAAYPADDIDQERRLLLREIGQTRAYPHVIVAETVAAALFGDARVGRPQVGTPGTVEAVTRDDVAGYAARTLRRAGATLVLTGDLEDESARSLVEKAFSGWTTEAEASGEIAAGASPQTSSTPRVLLIDWPDAPQATVRLAGPGITRGDPRWPAMFVANYAVGGSFGSRLNTELRERRGLTYGIGSGLDPTRRFGTFGVGASVRADAVAEAVSETLTILSAASGTITGDEVAVGVRAASDSAPLSFERSTAVAERVETLCVQRLPLDHVDANLERIRAVTPESANAAYRDVIHPDALTIVIAADAATQRASLEALGHGELELVARQ